MGPGQVHFFSGFTDHHTQLKHLKKYNPDGQYTDTLLGWLQVLYLMHQTIMKVVRLPVERLRMGYSIHLLAQVQMA
jgi:hypothetical protein